MRRAPIPGGYHQRHTQRRAQDVQIHDEQARYSHLLAVRAFELSEPKMPYSIDHLSELFTNGDNLHVWQIFNAMIASRNTRSSFSTLNKRNPATSTGKEPSAIFKNISSIIA
jgi:hypothetical protein